MIYWFLSDYGLDTGTAEPGHTHPSCKRGTLAEAGA